ncbi:hypothetical protein DY000_02040194 [Brassica cretica]|uniref:Uncharacterized protein n=1 Tax=Brassica cretica TaxID=69181 RepID=A0ABQ7B4C4_BRACR|nr:hypothetical protein DY000_02040194 [Brassica cretica]
MLLHFGRVLVLVVSSADAAQDVLKTHDRVFASRPRSKIFRKLHYDGRDVGLAPYGEYWRQMKSVCVLHLLSNKMVRSFRDVRKEEIRIVMENIRKSNSSRINKYGGDTDFMELIERFEKLLGSFSIGTYVPWLAWLDWISGLDAEVEKTKNDFDEFLERVVQDHVDGGGDKNDFVHVLLAIQREVMINVWAIGREAATWGPDAELFRPERHLDTSVDFRGQDFHLIPFGAGRRICPAISFATVLIELVLANLVHQFDWRSTDDDQTDVPEAIGIGIRRMFPLYAIASSNYLTWGVINIYIMIYFM